MSIETPDADCPALLIVQVCVVSVNAAMLTVQVATAVVVVNAESTGPDSTVPSRAGIDSWHVVERRAPVTAMVVVPGVPARAGVKLTTCGGSPVAL